MGRISGTRVTGHRSLNLGARATNQALKWALEKSEASGAARALLAAIARRARGCMAMPAPGELMRELGCRRSTFYWCLSQLEKLGEIEKRVGRFGSETMPLFHLQLYCQSIENLAATCEFSSPGSVYSENLLSPEKATYWTVSSDPISGCPVEKVSSGNLGVEKKINGRQGVLFPAVLTEEQAREACEECGGQGWKMVRYIKDGEEKEGLAICRHAVARLAGRWGVAQSALVESFWKMQLQGSPFAETKLGTLLFKGSG